MSTPLTADTLHRAIAGDLDAFLLVRESTPAELSAAASQTDRLVLTPVAVASILRKLRAGAITPTTARTWASFVRRGYVVEASPSPEPVAPIEIVYDSEREDEVGEAVGRLDELGDLIDGTITEPELDELIDRLELDPN
jgi:hypothetical protein